MKAQTVQIEKEQTVRQLLQDLELDESMYFVSVDGEMAKMDTVVKPGQEVKPIPIIKGG